MNIKSSLGRGLHDEDLQNDKPRHSRCRHYLKVYVICCAVSAFLAVGYAEMGHDKGWNRAESWYARLHTHPFFYKQAVK